MQSRSRSADAPQRFRYYAATVSLRLIPRLWTSPSTRYDIHHDWGRHMTTTTDPAGTSFTERPTASAVQKAPQLRDDQPLVTLDHLSISAEPGSLTSPAFFFQQAGS